MGVKKYVQEVVKEGRRVRWPKWEDFYPTLIAVLVVCTIAAIFLSLEDWAAGSLINQLKDLFSAISSSSEDSASDTLEEAMLLVTMFGGLF